MLSHETSSRYPHQTEAVEAVLASLENMDDHVVLNPTACDFPVTTDPAVVRQFLERHSREGGLFFASVIPRWC